MKKIILLLMTLFFLGCESKQSLVDQINSNQSSTKSYLNQTKTAVKDYDKTKLNQFTGNALDESQKLEKSLKTFTNDNNKDELRSALVASVSQLDDAKRYYTTILSVTSELAKIKKAVPKDTTLDKEKDIRNLEAQASQFKNKGDMLNDYLGYLLQTKNEYSILVKSKDLFVLYQATLLDKDFNKTKANLQNILAELKTGYVRTISNLKEDIKPVVFYLHLDSYGDPIYNNDDDIKYGEVSQGIYNSTRIEDKRDLNGRSVVIVDKQLISTYTGLVTTKIQDVTIKTEKDVIEISEEDYRKYKQIMRDNNVNELIIESKIPGVFDDEKSVTPYPVTFGPMFGYQGNPNTSGFDGSSFFMGYILSDLMNSGSRYDYNQYHSRYGYDNYNNYNRYKSDSFKSNNGVQSKPSTPSVKAATEKVVKAPVKSTFNSKSGATYKSFAKPKLPTKSFEAKDTKAVSQKFKAKSGATYKSFAKPNVSAAKSAISRGSFGGGRSGSSGG